MDRNRNVSALSGWLMLVVNLIAYAVGVGVLIAAVDIQDEGLVIVSIFVIMFAGFVSGGFFIVNPNFCALLVLFGRYKGTVTANGFHWANPLIRKKKMSLRVRNQETSKLKVNDRSGSPIEIAAVVVWRVTDPYRAQFEVDNYTEYVSVQSESALRHMASNYAYDGEDDEFTLRGSTDEVSGELSKELQVRLDRAGVDVMEARLSHLAYAPEIASEMLRRQQASAVVAARSKIVEGAVGMVEQALDMLSGREIVTLDDDRRAAMVSNLLVVLCGDRATQPVINTGTIHQ